MEINQSVWQKQREGDELSLRKIIEQQQKEKDEITEKVISVIKEKKKLVRDKVKCVVVFALPQSEVLDRSEVRRSVASLRELLTS